MHPFGTGGNKGHQGSSGGSGSNLGNKEANLMPVPSPQQIQYLNPLEGQELTIQKQPNTSLRESDLLSPSVPSSNPSQQQDPNRPPPGAAIPPNNDMSQGGGPQGGPSDPNL